jgi:hypothetical protein
MNLAGTAYSLPKWGAAVLRPYGETLQLYRYGFYFGVVG